MAPLAFDSAVSLYQQILIRRQDSYQSALASGKYRPIVYPRDAIPALCLLLGIILLPRLPGHVAQLARTPLFALILVHCFYVVKSCRNIGMAGGYGIGLACAWGCIMSLVLLVLDDIRGFTRLELRRPEAGTNDGEHANAEDGEASGRTQGRIRRRKGEPVEPPSANIAGSISSHQDMKHKLIWQPYPKSFWHAVEWSLDLMTAFRGVNWNFRIPTVPSLDTDRASNSSTHPAIKKVQRRAVMSFFFHYLLLDLLKLIWTHDPYFLGLATISSPHPLQVLDGHPFFIRSARLIISVISIYSALMFVFSLCPLFFPTIAPMLIHPEKIPWHARAPILEASMYPSYWGSPVALFDKGLAGLWGKVWHQMFRFGISEPSRSIIEHLKLKPHSGAARIIQLVVAFSLTGFLHATASFTAFPATHDQTRPLSGPLLFFMLQAFGIILQRSLSVALTTKKLPTSLRRVGNGIYVFGYGYLTGPLLVDDFARSGIWLFEPLPISFSRGITGGGWWHWGTLGDWVGIWKGINWWESGIAIY